MKTKYSIFIIVFIFLLTLSACTFKIESSSKKMIEDAAKKKFEEMTKDISIFEDDPDIELDEKPVIYLYPEEKTNINIKLHYKGELVVSYPNYNNGWDVVAYPDGKIINKADNEEYSYLFWEGYSDIQYDFSSGFIVKGNETEAFLKEKLKFMGLTPKEYNEFIVYWLPKMINNPYNLISFQEDIYTENAVLEISPEPDSIQRIFMAVKPLNEKIEINEQELKSFNRKGFTLIEWGGIMLN